MKCQVKNIKQKIKKPDEKVLVVNRKHIFPHGTWQGIKATSFDEYLEIIKNKKEFLWRSSIEENQSYKQIIPYLVFRHNNQYFLMQRSAQASESRLQNKYSLGIGGHIREQDIEGKTIIDWARREFNEEINYQGSFTTKSLGIINDDSNAVGKVHLGFVFLLEGNSDAITIKSELKSGSLVPLNKCKSCNKQMEKWSQIVVSFLEQYHN